MIFFYKRILYLFSILFIGMASSATTLVTKIDTDDCIECKTIKMKYAASNSPIIVKSCVWA